MESRHPSEVPSEVTAVSLHSVIVKKGHYEQCCSLIVSTLAGTSQHFVIHWPSPVTSLMSGNTRADGYYGSSFLLWWVILNLKLLHFS